MFVGETLSFDSASHGGDGRYSFYTIATDNSGNVEDAPSEADATTVVITSFSGDTVYVSPSVGGSELGADWGNPLTELTVALEVAQLYTVSEIWVSGGIYRESLTIPSGVSLYGGFSGAETDLSERQLGTNVTIIDGSEADGGNPADHVVLMDGVTNVRLDGLLITGGYANGGYESSNGGGIYIKNVDDTSKIANCVISGNHANERGGGLYLSSSSPEIVNCVISGNEAVGYYTGYGSGLYLTSSSPEIVNCVISGNWAYYDGGGVYLYNNSSPNIQNCVINDNYARSWGGGLYSYSQSAATVSNTIFEGNDKYAIYEAGADFDPTVSHCLFYDNPDGDYRDYETGSQTGANNIVLNVPEASEIRDGDPKFVMDGSDKVTGSWTSASSYDPDTNRTTFVNSSGTPFIPGALVGSLINPDTSYTSKPRHLLVLSNTATTVEVMGDKTGYVSSGDYYVIVDYHLEDGSGALDQGDVGSAPSEDFEEDVRPGGDGVVDIGADEATDSYVPSTDTIDPASKTLPLSQWVSTSAFDVSHVANDGESGVAQVELFYSKDGDAYQPAGVFVGETLSFDSASHGGDGRYSFYTIATDNSGNVEDAPSEADATTVVITSFSGDTVYVSPSVGGSELGADWGNPLTELTVALEVAQLYTVSEIWVSGGIYRESLTIPSGVSLYGGFSGAETDLSERQLGKNVTIIDGSEADGGNPADHVVLMDGVTNVRLDGLLITGGYANGGYESSNGGGIYIKNVDDTSKIANCVISGNHANEKGGGLYLSSSSPEIVNCVISGNEAVGYNGYGSGLYLTSSSPEIVNCVISGNWAYYDGGGVYLYNNSSPNIQNCVINDNYARSWGGGLYSYSQSAATVSNTIFEGNDKYAIYEAGADFDPTVSHCLFYDNPDGDYRDYETGSQTGANNIVLNVPEASEIRDGDPKFVMDGSDKVTGSWTSASTYNSETNRTTFVNSWASFVPGALVGRLINPDKTYTSGPLHLLVLSNTATTVEVMGDKTGYVSSGDYYVIVDYHLEDGSDASDHGDTASAPDTDFEGGGGGDPRPDCNGSVDIGVDENPSEFNTYYRDLDNDMYGDPNDTIESCTQPAGYVDNSDDCDDSDPTINPDTVWYKDADEDGYSDGSTQTQCERPADYYLASELTDTTGDCDDTDGNEFPGQVWYKDADSDGYSDGSTQTQCERPVDYYLASELTDTSGDCNDADTTVHPGAAEVCNGVDDNCNSQIDEGVKNTYYQDSDGDGYGDPNSTTEACTAPMGYVSDNTDCNDGDGSINPETVWYKDADEDGYSDGSTQTQCERPANHYLASELTDIIG